MSSAALRRVSKRSTSMPTVEAGTRFAKPTSLADLVEISIRLGSVASLCKAKDVYRNYGL